MTPENELRLRYWMYTLPSTLWIIPVLAVVVLNPFWFRQAWKEWFADWMEGWLERRAQYLKPYYDKVKLFDMIKGTCGPKNNTPGRPKLL